MPRCMAWTLGVVPSDPQERGEEKGAEFHSSVRGWKPPWETLRSPGVLEEGAVPSVELGIPVGGARKVELLGQSREGSK